MRIAIFSDIHANRAALEAAITDANANGVTRYWSLGDVVDGGHDARWCQEWVWEHCDVHLLGNHEEALLLFDKREVPEHPVYAQSVPYSLKLARFNSGTLACSLHDLTPAHLERIPRQRSIMAILPDGTVMDLTEMQPDTRIEAVLVHASPKNTTHWRILSATDASQSFDELATRAAASQPPGVPRLIFAGHTHHARAWSITPSSWMAKKRTLPPGEVIDIADGSWCITVGSIGEPRDDQYGSYGIWDTDAATFTRRRVDCDV